MWSESEAPEAHRPVTGVAEFDEAAEPHLARATRLAKRVARLSRLNQLSQDVNLFEAVRLLNDSRQALQELTETVDVLTGIVAATELASDDWAVTTWAEAFLVELRTLEVPVEETSAFPDYHVFPFDVHVDLQAGAALINNRTTHVMRPRALAKLVQQERDRLFNARFNDQQFMKALAVVYDLMTKDKQEFAVDLRRVHEVLSARSGTASYPLRLFAFDLYRLRYQSNMMYRGRKFVLHETRNGTAKGAVQVPKPGGGFDNLGSFEMAAEG